MIAASLLALLLAGDDPPQPVEWLVVGPLDFGPRSVLPLDPVLAAVFAEAEPRWPRAGDALGARRWKAVRADERGEVKDEALARGYAYARVASDRDRVVLAEVEGGSTLFVNGEPYTADVYRYGFVRVPVALRKGANDLLVRCPRGGFALRFEEPPAPVVIETRDATLPDLVEGEPIETWGAVPILNATGETIRGAALEAGSARVDLPPLAPLAVLKTPFPIREGPKIRLVASSAGRRHEAGVELRLRKKGESFKRTFLSEVDGSVQYFAALPAKPGGERGPPALVLTLHGAGVEATGQVDSYAAKEGAVLVAPTNRRPFGFDWEAWGRLDALEVLERATRDFAADPARVYLTGHSMGGHGVWQLASLFPDRFAAAGPSAGWLSFSTYAGAPPSEGRAAELFRRAAASSDTLALARNLAPLPILAIHGEADDNVPVAELRRAAKELGTFHPRFRAHEEKGAGHWWDRPGTPGVECVDLPELFAHFRGERRNATPERIDFRTFSPGVSSRCGWAEILCQAEPHAPSRVAGRRTEGGLEVETENVARLRLDASGTLVVDGDRIAAERGPVELTRDGGAWKVGSPPGLRKTPALYGPFAQAFERPFVLVYGTKGSPEATRTALAKARFDAQAWWYRGNGRAVVLADTEVDDATARSHNLVLYGDEASNGLWRARAAGLPIRTTAGELAIAGERLAGDLAFVAVHPDPAAPDRLLALAGATGPAGRFALLAANWFLSGAGFPDFAAWDASVFTKGVEGVRAAGFFDPDWKPDPRNRFVAR